MMMSPTGRYQMAFPKAPGVLSEDLVSPEIQVGCWVTWTKSGDDIPPGMVGKVTSVKPESGRVKVRFPAGTWAFEVETVPGSAKRLGHHQ